MANDDVKNIVEALKKVAKQLGVEPREVKLRDLTDSGLVSRKAIERTPGLNAIKNAYFPVTDKDLKGKAKVSELNSYVSKLESKLGSTLNLTEELSNAIKTIPAIKVKPFIVKDKKKLDRALNLVLSDDHIGADINAAETGGLTYGKLEEARRLARITKETIEYKKQYRSTTKLNLLLLGDIIQNSLHDPRDGAPVAEQVCRAIYLINQMVAQFSASFPQIDVYCASGNHGRNTGRHHHGRAVNQKWDSLETVIYYAVKEACKHLTNVKFTIPKTPFVVYEVFGSKIFATHGDSVLAAGYPGKSINMGKIESQVNRFNASLTDKDEYSVVVSGHVHTGSIVHMSNGTVSITNGALVPSDEFAVSIGLLENTCGQYIFESVENYPVGDTRFIKVGINDDKDKSLDVIIKPWESL